MTSKNLVLDFECKINYSVKMIIWDKEKTDRIFEMRQQGITYQEIAQEFGTNKANISAVITRMREQGYSSIIKAKPWSLDEELELIELRSQGKNNKEIAEILGKSHDSVKRKASNLIRSGITDWKGKPILSRADPIKLDLPREELLEIVRKYVSYEACPTSLASNVKRIFGTWTKALEAAGISGNIGGKFDPNKVTRVYLLDFGDFYKIGVTQQQIKSRFHGAPPYTILDFVETDLDNAVYLEKELKKAVTQYVAEHPWFDRNGKTECFKTDRPISCLEDIFAP